MPENPQPSADDAQNARPSPCLACAVSYDCANKMGIDRRHAKDKRLCRRAAFIIRDVYLCKARRVQYSCHCNAPPRTNITHSLGLSNCTTHTSSSRCLQTGRRNSKRKPSNFNNAMGMCYRYVPHYRVCVWGNSITKWTAYLNTPPLLALWREMDNRVALEVHFTIVHFLDVHPKAAQS